MADTATVSQTIATVTVAVAPAFASGFAVQQALQIIDPLLAKSNRVANNKQAIMGLISLVLGGLIVSVGDVKILGVLMKAAGDMGLLVKTAGDSTGATASLWVDYPVSALVISAGTEGFNSIMKFLSYKKEAVKPDAVKTEDAAAKKTS